MNAHRTLAERPALTNALTAGVIVVALALLAYDVARPPAATLNGQVYFTTDDGRTYFPDDLAKLPPFDHAGKPAVRAYVYACGDGRPFVAYLERYTPKGLAGVKRTDPGDKIPVDREFVAAAETEVKKPDDGDWVKRAGPAGERVIDVRCPDGGPTPPHLVLPGD